MSTEQQMQQAYQLIKQGRKEEAAAILVPIVRADNDNADAWWLLANAVSSSDQAKRALQMVLRVRPDDDRARRMLAKLNGEPIAPPRPPAEPPRTSKRAAPADDPFAPPADPPRAADQPFDDDPFAEKQPESRPSKPAPRPESGTKRSAQPSSTGSRRTKPPAKRTSRGADDPFAAIDDFDGDPFTDLDLEGGKRRKDGAPAPERRRSPALAILGLLLVIIIAVALAFVVLNQAQNQPTTTQTADTPDPAVAISTELMQTIMANPEMATGMALTSPQAALDMAVETLQAQLSSSDVDPTAFAQTVTAFAETGAMLDLNETLTAVAADSEAAMTQVATMGAGLSETLAVQLTPGPDLSALTSPPSLLQTQTVIIPDGQQTAFARAAQTPNIVETLTAQPNALETPANVIVMTMAAQAAEISEGVSVPIATMSVGETGSILPSDVVEDQGEIGYGEVVSQSLPLRVDHQWQFTGEAGDTVIIDLSAVENSIDPQLALLDPSGAIIAENDDVDLSQNRNSHIEFTLPESGTYSILVSAFGGESGDYELSLNVATE
jgi:hypothetical protein